MNKKDNVIITTLNNHDMKSRGIGKNIKYLKLLSQHMRIWYESHCWAMKDQASLRKCADSPDPSLLAYTNYGCRWRFRIKFRPLALLVTSAWALKGGFCASVISTKNTVNQNIMCYCMPGSWVGGSGPTARKQLIQRGLFFFLLNLFYSFTGDPRVYQWTDLFLRKLTFPNVPEESNIFLGGVQLFPGGPNANFY